MSGDTERQENYGELFNHRQGNLSDEKFRKNKIAIF